MDVRTQSKDGRRVASVAECEAKIAEELRRKQKEWLRELRQQPRKFRQLEEQIHQRFQELADQLVASVMAEATTDSPVLDLEKKV
jgi:DNA-binding protein H-NS